MADYLVRMLGENYKEAPRAVIEEVAEGAATAQLQHAQDILSLAEVTPHKRKDPRILRAQDVVDRLT